MIILGCRSLLMIFNELMIDCFTKTILGKERNPLIPFGVLKTQLEDVFPLSKASCIPNP